MTVKTINVEPNWPTLNRYFAEMAEAETSTTKVTWAALGAAIMPGDEGIFVLLTTGTKFKLLTKNEKWWTVGVGDAATRRWDALKERAFVTGELIAGEWVTCPPEEA